MVGRMVRPRPRSERGRLCPDGQVQQQENKQGSRGGGGKTCEPARYAATSERNADNTLTSRDPCRLPERGSARKRGLAACGRSRRRPKAYSTRSANHSSAVVEQAFSPAFGPRYDFCHRPLAHYPGTLHPELAPQAGPEVRQGRSWNYASLTKPWRNAR
jgi:hypothetical protein